MSKIDVSLSKTLKLTNVLKVRCNIEKEDFDLNLIISRMQSYIRIKGAEQIGPLIQHTDVVLENNGKVNISLVLMMQCNTILHNVSEPYVMEPEIKITDCMYCRYRGPEEKLKFAYDKLQIEAFEKDIPLKRSSYTVFVSQSEEEIIVADIFMERENEL